MNPNFIPVGTFSDITGVDLHTLEVWHQQGVLCPVQQSDAGVFYLPEQYQVVEHILALLGSGMPLERLPAFLQHPENHAALLQKHHDHLIDELFQLQRKLQVTRHLQTCPERRRTELIHVPYRFYVGLPVVCGFGTLDVVREKAAKQVLDYAVLGGLPHAGAPTMITRLPLSMQGQPWWGSMKRIEEVGHLELEFLMALPVTAQHEPVKPFQTLQLPAMSLLFHEHHGRHHALHFTHQEVQQFALEAGLTLGGLMMEAYQVGPWNRVPSQLFVTQVMYQVEAAGVR